MRESGMEKRPGASKAPIDITGDAGPWEVFALYGWFEKVPVGIGLGAEVMAVSGA